MGIKLPSLKQIASYWRARDDFEGTFVKFDPRHKAWVPYSWGEPFCFACGWMPPTPYYETRWGSWLTKDVVVNLGLDAWDFAVGFLERGHLHDRCLGGANGNEVLALVGFVCHKKMTRGFSGTRDRAIDWINSRPRRDGWHQLASDMAFNARWMELRKGERWERPSKERILAVWDWAEAHLHEVSLQSQHEALR